MDFRAEIKRSISVDQRGIELGPSYAPILPKAEGYRTLVVDHADRDSLIAKYGSQGIDVSRIETVDAIDDGSDLLLLDETGQGFDFILASHVFEHLPNPLHFLQRCSRALKPDGRLILLVPDRRFCFDYLRPVSTTGQVFEAFLRHNTLHSPAALFDHNAYNARRNGVHVWAERSEGDMTIAGTAAAGYAAAVAQHDDYVDCHGWVFTPSSFRLIIEDFRALKLLDLGEIAFHPSIGCEFMIELSRSAADRGMDRRELALAAVREARDVEGNAVAAGLQGYVAGLPTADNAVRLLDPSWVGAFPPQYGVSAGEVPLFDDPRIGWMSQELGDAFTGMDVLELGPLEASHTAMMLGRGARSVLAVEANRLAYLKCLVAKEVMGLRDASFLLGDFRELLRQDQRHWPLIVACGVLYHMTEPLDLLTSLAGRTDRLFIWTHVFDHDAMPPGDPRLGLFTSEEVVETGGRPYSLHIRPYGNMNDATFCGGPLQGPRWMERADLLDFLSRAGYDDIRIAHETPDHPAGPALCILAQRSGRQAG